MPLQVVVIGASVAGLLAAAAAVTGGHQVTLLERDAGLDDPTARPGVPQGEQPHVFLYRGLLAVEDLLPGMRAELTALGAVSLDTGYLPWLAEDGWLPTEVGTFDVLSLTRPLFEHAVRRRVLALPGVTLRAGTRVAGLRQERTTWHAELADDTDVPADCVVDASGRSSRLPVWVAQAASAAVSEIDAGIGYASRMYAADPASFDAVGVVIQQTPETLSGGMALPVQGGHWLVAAIGCGDKRPPRDARAFDAFLDTLADPALATLARHGQPRSEVAVHRQTGNSRRHYERVADWPDGLVAIGDALCAFNPVYGQGITVAACEALLLRRELAGDPAPGYARRLHKKFARVVSLPWSIATSEDLRYPTSTGTQSLPQAALGRWTRELGRLASHGDLRAQAVMHRVYHLMGSPALLFQPQLVAAAVRARRRGYGPPSPRPASLAALTR